VFQWLKLVILTGIFTEKGEHSMNAILFAGQGSQYAGMGKELLSSNPELAYIFKTGSEILGYDLERLCFDESDENKENLSRTVFSQPAITAVNVLCFETAKKNGVKYSAIGGHSLGQYAALYAAEVLTLSDLFHVIKIRAEQSEWAVNKVGGAMAAVLKMNAKAISTILEEHGGKACIANYNSPQQSVIAGPEKDIEEVSKILQEKGARVMPLKVKGAFHTGLMSTAAGVFYEHILNVPFKEPKVTLYSNLTGDRLGEITSLNNFPTRLARHMSSPVLFTRELETMKNDGFTTFIELGPSKILSGLVKKTLPDVVTCNIEDNASLKQTLEVLYSLTA
jgi:[acyl-carrier-protein] S-malonyltransferase